MNPNIAHGLMLARIAEMHRQARRVGTGRTARPPSGASAGASPT